MVEFKKGKNLKLKKDSSVIVTVNKKKKYVEIKSKLKPSKIYAYVTRISKDTYMINKTGEIRKYKYKINKTEENVINNMRKLKKIIEYNFEGNFNELFITLTTSESINDEKTIQKYFKRFWRRLTNKYQNLEYIYVIESKNARLHIHCLIKDTTGQRLYIPNEEISAMWNVGFTKTTKISNNDFSNSSLDEEVYMIAEKNNIKMESQQVGITVIGQYMAKVKDKLGISKNARIFHKSKNIKMPKEEVLPYSEAVEKYTNGEQPIFEQTILIYNSSDSNIILNKVKKEYWKMK